ncbi:hypothetical protein MPC4_160049 [Methylocella tundrae]|uniref:Uncharacterized protein n=1 Tax=Methylocella tundrae TaxID=227605 RepID=A0A8B6M4W6_METTU|nr:hypothetical protein MPC4_160049 [Methylocella tundrae]
MMDIVAQIVRGLELTLRKRSHDVGELSDNEGRRRRLCQASLHSNLARRYGTRPQRVVGTASARLGKNERLLMRAKAALNPRRDGREVWPASRFTSVADPHGAGPRRSVGLNRGRPAF